MKVFIITDISRLENYHPEALSILAELLKTNASYVEKSPSERVKNHDIRRIRGNRKQDTQKRPSENSEWQKCAYCNY